MVNWEMELKRFLVKKYKEVVGEEISVENFSTIEIPFDLDLAGLTIKELGHIYAFAIMKEDFEQTDGLANEIAKRECGIKIDTNNVKQTGAIIIYQNNNPEKPIFSVPMKIYPDGMIVDFEKDEVMN
jgi:hypothetical protein